MRDPPGRRIETRLHLVVVVTRTALSQLPQSLTRDQAINNLNEIFVVFATTTIRGLPTEVEFGPTDGMPRDCALNLDHTDTVGKGHLTGTNHHARTGAD
jgi:hypothetical protein